MKKMMMLLVAALTLSSMAAAQQMKVDVEGLKKKTAASDADIQNDKKNTKAATWMNRGKVYYDADVEPTKGLRKFMSPTELTLLYGAPQSTRNETVNGITYDVQVYPWFDVYRPQGGDQVHFWKQKTFIVQNGLDVAAQAYAKAVELDARQAAKAKDQMKLILDQYRQTGDISFTGGDYKAAADAFIKVYDYSVLPLVNEPDTLSAYNAGYISVLAENFDNGLKYLNEAKRLGYDGDGEVYFLLYHAYMGKEQSANAESALKEGVQRYPNNSKLIESLIAYYTTTGQDASQMIPLVESALERDPNNYAFHFGLGLIYDKLGDFEKAAAEFKKASELNPEDFGSYFNLAITYIRKADSMLEEINAIPSNEPARYDEKLAEFNSYYKRSLPILEKAHALNPDETATVDLLKSIYFRFRDEGPEMMQNYEKYNEMLKTMQ